MEKSITLVFNHYGHFQWTVSVFLAIFNGLISSKVLNNSIKIIRKINVIVVYCRTNCRYFIGFTLTFLT